MIESQRKCGHPTILVVDDEHEILGLVALMLEKIGYVVITAENAEKAMLIARHQKEHLRLLLSDVMMPGMNGLEMCARIHGENPDLQCIYMSGYIPEDLSPVGQLRTGVNFISKPFSIKDIASLVERTIGHSGWGPPPPPRGGGLMARQFSSASAGARGMNEGHDLNGVMRAWSHCRAPVDNAQVPLPGIVKIARL